MTLLYPPERDPDRLKLQRLCANPFKISRFLHRESLGAVYVRARFNLLACIVVHSLINVLPGMTLLYQFSLVADTPSVTDSNDTECPPRFFKEFLDLGQVGLIASQGETMMHHLERQAIGLTDHLLELL